MRCIFVIIFIVGCAGLRAQNQQPPFAVRYISGYLTDNDSLQISSYIKKHKFHPVPNYELVVTDTAAYIHAYQKERERNENPLGSVFRSHNLYIDFRLKKEFRQSQPWNAGRYQVEATYRAQQFDLLKDSMVILGYTCYKAVPVNKTQAEQTHFWYAPALPYAVSMYGFTGLPGLVLAQETWSHHIRLVIIAERIEPETRKLIKPKKGTPIGALEFERLLSDLRTNFYLRSLY
jgi:GLPGLI family protein